MLMGEALKDENYRVLVIDADESNPGLCRMLGFNKEPVPLINLLSRFSIGELDLDTEWIAKDEITFQDIPSKYVSESGGLKFMMVGKIADPFQGCACEIADVTRDFVGKLILADNEIVLIDVEAGIESFGRGMERNVDTVLIVVEPSFESLAIAEKISYMADGIGVWMVRAILNKIPAEETRRKMVEALALKNVSQVGTVHLDSEVAEASFEGKSLGDSKARGEVKDFTRRLISEAR
jgi:CO dehydrogenase maturation factor